MYHVSLNLIDQWISFSQFTIHNTSHFHLVACGCLQDKGHHATLLPPWHCFFQIKCDCSSKSGARINYLQHFTWASCSITVLIESWSWSCSGGSNEHLCSRCLCDSGDTDQYVARWWHGSGRYCLCLLPVCMNLAMEELGIVAVDSERSMQDADEILPM
jgi:hypothetical protein